MPDRLLKDRTRKPPYVRPYQIAMDRLQDREMRTREDILQQARALTDEVSAGSQVVHEAFAYGPTGLISTHTHYFPGFAILLSLPLGTGIVAAPIVPPYVRPYQIAMDRLQDREMRTREDILQQARALTDEVSAGSQVVHEAFAYGPTGLISTHTHYFPGFAILLSLPLGTGIVAA